MCKNQIDKNIIGLLGDRVFNGFEKKIMGYWFDIGFYYGIIG